MSHKQQHFLLVGAGGVASYLVAPLLKAFHPFFLTIMDGDTLEKRNLDRQLFTEEWIGRHKAAALCCINNDLGDLTGTTISYQTEYLREETPPVDIPTAIICCADNHLARKACLHFGDELHIPVFIAGNEYYDNEAYVYHPDHMKPGSAQDPRVRHPEILTDTSGSPLTSCTGAAQDATPQLAVANFGAAYKLLALMWAWLVEVPQACDNPAMTDEGLEAMIANLPIHLRSSLYEHSYLPTSP
jgi:hypothetical protein